MKNRFDPIAMILIFCVGITVYSNTFYSPFHFDDEFYIVNNPAIRGLFDPLHIWNFWPSRFITFLSYALNYQLGGLDV